MRAIGVVRTPGITYVTNDCYPAAGPVTRTRLLWRAPVMSAPDTGHRSSDIAATGNGNASFPANRVRIDG